MPDTKQNVVHLLLLPCHPSLQSAGYHHHPSSDQESEAKKKKENEEKQPLQRLQQQQNNINAMIVKMFFSLKIRLSAFLALHQSWIESIRTKSFFHIHFPRKLSLSPKLRAGNNRPYPF